MKLVTTVQNLALTVETCAVVTSIHGQSPDIAMGVDKALEQKTGGDDSEFDTGAGDQGMMFGFCL